MIRAIFIGLVATAFAQDDSWVVEIASGPVRGYKQDDLFVFYNIPYATGPTGVDRYKAPLPPPQWEDTFDAVDRNIVCPQSTRGGDNTELTEDCLVANVYVPESRGQKLAVVILVHGGAYQGGSGQAVTLNDVVGKSQNIIAVNFNYRLGAHGFLCLGTEDVPGNAGLKDAVALMRWVRDNIARFGGNPDDVTINGCSSGGSMVDLLMISELTQGLFHKAIPESGGNVAAWSVQQAPVEQARKIAHQHNYTDIDDIYALERLYKTLSIEEIARMSNNMDIPDTILNFFPCVERDLGQERVITDSPVNIIKSGNYIQVPTLYGFDNMEGMTRFSMYDDYIQRMNANFSVFITGDLTFENEEERDAVAREIKEFYFGEGEINDDTVLGYVDFFTDTVFAYPMVRSAKLHTQRAHKQLYLYEYSFAEDSLNGEVPARFADVVRGAGHCAQSDTVTDMKRNTNVSQEYEKMRSIMREMWTNFILTGVPSSQQVEFQWPPAESGASPHVSLGHEIRVLSDMIPERAAFWDNLYEKYYLQPQTPPAPTAEETI